MDTVTPYSTSVRMEQRLSEDPWDCLFGSDSITDAIQYRSEMFHMDICCCGNTGSSLDCLGLGFGFNGNLLSEIEEDPAGFSCEKSRSSASNLEDLNLDSDSELALTLDPNLILPHNGPIRSPTPGSEVPMLGASTKRRGIVALEEDETENESEPERTENDEDSEEEEEEEEEESEENEHNETEYETAEEVTEEEEDEDEDEDEDEEAEDEEDEDDEVPAGVRRPPPSSSLETPTSIPPSALTATAPTIHLTRVPMQQHPKIGAMKVHDIKVLTASPAAGQTSHHIRKQVYNNNLHDIGPGTVTTVMIQAKREKEPAGGAVENPYPKPAYSYSCLIAMALKNSRTGSLPVSEIYNFMCRHFPYFKTAPNGWKNSVRHNLSLNKCFEKIEKPPGSGSQRKGCLWAIHPSKVAKMDEEVRKWSRKDPVAIKRAMVCPDQLELLERGEMRYEGDEGHEEMYEDAESYASSENETVGPDEADETVNGDEEARLLEAGDEARFEAANDEEATRPDVDVVDDDIVVEELYDDIEIDDDVTAADAGDVLDTRLLPGGGGGGGFRQQPREQQQQSFVYVSCQKRPKTLAGPQNDYVYQQIDAPTPRRKAHVAQLGTPEAGIL